MFFHLFLLAYVLLFSLCFFFSCFLSRCGVCLSCSLLFVSLTCWKLSDPNELSIVLGEIRRLIVPMDMVNAKPVVAGSKSQSSPNTKPSSVISVAATKLLKMGMTCVETGKSPELLAGVLRTLSAWKYGNDAALPLLVKVFEKNGRICFLSNLPLLVKVFEKN